MVWQEVLQQYYKEIERVNRDINHDKVLGAIDILYEAWKAGKTVFSMGNGGSASTASHFASDLAKFTIVPGKPRFKVSCLNDNVPLVSAWTNDAGFGSIFVGQLEPWLQKDDVIVGFSVHGGSGLGDAGPWSQNLVQAMDLAKNRGAKIIGLSGFDGGAMEAMADVSLVVPVDSEPIATPLIESYHVVLHHLICLGLKERIGSLVDG